jgi:hypothetical protein
MQKENKTIILKNVRCSFPQLYGKKENDGQTFNPGITVLLDQKVHADEIQTLINRIKEIINENSKLKKQPPKGDKLCLRGPDSDSYRDEYPNNCLLLRAGNKKNPVVLHKDLTRMTEEDNIIYSGCYVNVKVNLWGQANQFGRRVNASLLAVQFSADGDSFDGSYVSPEEAAKGFDSSVETSENEQISNDDFLN